MEKNEFIKIYQRGIQDNPLEIKYKEIAQNILSRVVKYETLQLMNEMLRVVRTPHLSSVISEEYFSERGVYHPEIQNIVAYLRKRKRGFKILLLGEPGTGKTTISNKLNARTEACRIISLTEPIDSAHICIEDVDLLLNKTGNERGGTSLHCLLTVLDNAQTAILTTNSLQLDEAVTRAGRIDRVFYIGGIPLSDLERWVATKLNGFYFYWGLKGVIAQPDLVEDIKDYITNCISNKEVTLLRDGTITGAVLEKLMNTYLLSYELPEEPPIRYDKITKVIRGVLIPCRDFIGVTYELSTDRRDRGGGRITKATTTHELK